MMQTITVADLQEMVSAAKGNLQKMAHVEAVVMGILEQDPDNWPALFYLAVIMIHTNRGHLASTVLHRVTHFVQNVPEVWNNLGTAYRQCHRNKEAEEAFLKALQLSPSDSDILNNIGSLHVNEGTPHVGEVWLEKALAAEPRNHQAHWNLSLCQLEQEKWDPGFREYAYGILTGDRPVKVYDDAVWWDGEEHPTKTLVIYGEQGIGDEIMFASCIPDAVAKFKGRVIFDCHPRLVELFRRSFPDLTIFPTRKELQRERLPWLDNIRVDYRIAIGNLPKFVRTDASAFPKAAYLTPDPARVAEYEQWLDCMGDGPFVGLSWVGGHKSTRKDLRCMSLDQMLGITQAVGAIPISCQYTDHNKEAAARGIHTFPEIFEMTKWDRYDIVKDGKPVAAAKTKPEAKQFAMQIGGTVEHITGPAFDYDDTAAFVMAISKRGAIVSVNTTLVHLCGAMGVPCFTLTPSKPAWRYGQKRHDMVWYPKDSVRQYRQKGEDWKPAIEALISDLNAYFGQNYMEAASC